MGYARLRFAPRPSSAHSPFPLPLPMRSDLLKTEADFRPIMGKVQDIVQVCIFWCCCFCPHLGTLP